MENEDATLRNRKRSLAAEAALRRLSSSGNNSVDDNNNNNNNNTTKEYEDLLDDLYETSAYNKQEDNDIKPSSNNINSEEEKKLFIKKETLIDDLACPICFRLLYEPISLNCGHTYCRSCISKALSAKASQECPVCRAPLMLDTSTAKVNIIVQKLLNKHCETELIERKKEETEDISELEQTRPSIDVFLLPSLVVMPGQKIVLTVFEPRYLLLCERAMQDLGVFGLQRYPNSSVGTLMKINTLRNDDSSSRRRLIISCTGQQPYKPENLTVEPNTNSLHRCTANCIPPPEYVPGQADEIIFNSYNRASEIYENTPPREKTLIINDIGPIPEFGSDPFKLLYWLAACLPLHLRRKEGILDNSLSIENRFAILNHVLFNNARPPTFSTNMGNPMFSRANSGLLQSCLIFAVVFFGLLYSYAFKKSVY